MVEREFRFLKLYSPFIFTLDGTNHKLTKVSGDLAADQYGKVHRINPFALVFPLKPSQKVTTNDSHTETCTCTNSPTY